MRLAPDPGTLVTAQALQGAFGALLLPQGFGIIRETFPEAELPEAFGLFGPVMGLCAVAGPVVGGLLAGADLFGSGWRLVFLVNLPLGLLASAGAVRRVPRGKSDAGLRLDVPSMLPAGAASAAVVFPLVQGPDLGRPLWSLLLPAAGPLGFLVFARIQRRRPSPLMAPGLLANRGYTCGIVVALVFFASFTGLMLVLSLFLQGPLGLSPQGRGTPSPPWPSGSP
ncbi:MFS transporter [Streptomyces sp. NPDC051578]|uniref:MFS transporter n=1 Tax=Streptomyces sp. NPDC051578 TaxID=3365662 RepID=UPI0037AC4878